MQQGALQTAENFKQFRQETRKYAKVFYGPLYSSNDANGLSIAANAATRQLPATSMVFFSTAVGQTGQGYVRPLRFSETNLDGGNGQLPAGFGYAARSLSVVLPPQLPMGLKDFLTRHSSIAHVRHSHRWEAGATIFWPEGRFGHQSKSVSSTFANTLIQYGVNGACEGRRFPQGGELYFPPNEQIQFNLETYEPVFCTTDGATWNGGIFGVDPGGNGLNAVDGAPIFIEMEGFRYEQATA